MLNHYYLSTGPIQLAGTGPALGQYIAPALAQCWTSIGPTLGQYHMPALARFTAAVQRPNTYKCNIFVADIIKAAGAKAPHRHWWKWSPIAAAEWGNSKSSVLEDANCWTLVSSTTDAKRGDVISDGHHVGIVTGKSLTTSASSIEHQVVTNDWGFRDSQNPTIWRYTC
ncbi:hypothetical protein NP493_1466g00019 [Ridgeia piscesae]|uniref:Uncharacterized protein n=1 Tax=Ridgeia piscesae TaxID=27915 RepID=A0AAD9K2L6_RIDPI|nr:hypothetical protein NP493_1466g00019 [Ridgeia piscesae]